jgi:hypothetical protein
MEMANRTDQVERRLVMKCKTIAKNFTIAAVTALALGIAPAAKAADERCSNASVKGTYAFEAAGSAIGPPNVFLVDVDFAQTFDGKSRFDGHWVPKP